MKKPSRVKLKTMRAHGLLAACVLFALCWTLGASASQDDTPPIWSTSEGGAGNRATLPSAMQSGATDDLTIHPPFDPAAFAARLAIDSTAVDTIRLLVILADFWDEQMNNSRFLPSRQMFDSMLFSDNTKHGVVNPTGSLTDYFREVSRGRIYIQADLIGWLTMPHPYLYYNNDEHSPWWNQLAVDALHLADSTVDFGRYDSNHDGYADGVIIVAAEPDERFGPFEVSPHMAELNSSLTLDGVTVTSYALNPTLIQDFVSFTAHMIPIGYFCRQVGYMLGLPDLENRYGREVPSPGLSSWSLMASGYLNGDGRIPAGLDAWSRTKLSTLLTGGTGLVHIVEVDSNLYQAQIPMVESDPTIYRLTERIGDKKEFWLVENRQQVGFDQALPGSGLCIYHVDSSVVNDTNSLRPLVAFESSSGTGAWSGSAWPGWTNNRTFNDFTTPNARNYRDSAPTGIAVWGISNSEPYMNGNLNVTYSYPRIRFSAVDSVRLYDVGGSNGNGIPEAGETVDLYFGLRNDMRKTYGWEATLTCDNPAVVFDLNSVAQPGPIDPALPTVTSVNPVRFHLPLDFKTAFVNFTLEIASDSSDGSGDRRFHDTLHFMRVLGAPRVLIVDDDNGAAFERKYADFFTCMSEPSDIWDVRSLGSPAGNLLNRYKCVFWLTGHPVSGGQLSLSDVTAMKEFLSSGHGLALSGFTAGDQLTALDSTFLRDYLHLRWHAVTTPILPIMRGDSRNYVSVGLMYRLSSTTPSFIRGTLEPVAGGDSAFYPADNSGTILPGCVGVTYTGSYRSFFLAVPPEYIAIDTGYPDRWNNRQPLDSLLAHVFNFMTAQSFVGLNAWSGANGTIEPSGDLVVGYGEDRHFTFSPSWGYNVADITVDGVSVGKGTDYTLKNITANHSISVTFSTCCVGKTGNVDGSLNDTPDISDVFALADFLAGRGQLSNCQFESDTNRDRIVDLSDLFALIDYLSNAVELPDCP